MPALADAAASGADAANSAYMRHSKGPGAGKKTTDHMDKFALPTAAGFGENGLELVSDGLHAIACRCCYLLQAATRRQVICYSRLPVREVKKDLQYWSALNIAADGA